MAGIVKRKGARLPHRTLEGAAYFVTFRTFDSLPGHDAKQFRLEAQNAEAALRRKMGRDLTLREVSDVRWKVAGKAEKLLDQGMGECLLGRHKIAEIVRDTLMHFDRQRYDIYAWCVMPNHVHTIIKPHPEQELSKIVLSWKSWSARYANEHLNRDGRFWQREYFDRIIRTPDAFEGTVRYVLQNPARAGLVDWPHFGSRDADLSSIVWPALDY